MEPTIIMSAEFRAAVYKEIQTINEVMENYVWEENNFEMDDYMNYRADLEKLLDWTITE